MNPMLWQPIPSPMKIYGLSDDPDEFRFPMCLLNYQREIKWYALYFLTHKSLRFYSSLKIINPCIQYIIIPE